MNSAQAFIAFLRCEATQAEERAKSLRATAATIEANNSGEGRTTKKKRKREKVKRAPTAYTLFVHENYETIKRAANANNNNIRGNNNGEGGRGEMASRDIIALVAQQWAQCTEAEKQMWQFRADQLKHSAGAESEHNMAAAIHIHQRANAAAAAAFKLEDDDEIPELPPPSEVHHDPNGGGGDLHNKRQRSVRSKLRADLVLAGTHAV